MADVILAAMGTLIVVALLVVLVQPWWEIRYRRLRRLNSLTSPELSGCLRELVGIAGLTREPAFLVDPANHFQRAHVFGGFRRQYVCLNAGLLPLLSKDRPAFRGVLLHELAHLRNHDVPVTYLARNAVLRVRESRADVRAGTWQEMPDYLALLHGARLPQWWPGWVLTHPRPDQRAQVLDDPGRLYRPSFWSLASAGIALTLAVRHLAISLTLLLSAHHLVFSVLMWVVFDAPVAGLLVVATWRAVIFARMESRVFAAVLVPGAALGIGLIIGYLIDLTPFSTQPGLASSPETVGAAVALPLLVVLVGAWTACCAQARLDRAPLGSLRWPLAVTAAAATTLIALYAGWWAGSGWPSVLNLAVSIGGQVTSFAAGLGWGPFGWIPVAVAYHPLSILDLSNVDLIQGFLLAHADGRAGLAGAPRPALLPRQGTPGLRSLPCTSTPSTSCGARSPPWPES